MVWNPEVTAGNVILFATLLAAIVGLFLNLRHLRITTRQNRAKNLIDLYNTWKADKEVAKLYYEIEYSRFQYRAAEFHGNAGLEQPMDKLLGFFNNVARLYTMEVITLEDIKNFEWEFLAVYRNKGVQQYIAFIDDVARVRGVSSGPFDSFKKVGQILDEQKPK